MKRDLIFSPILLIVGVLLFLLRTTGMTVHIAVSVVGLLALVVYAVLTKKDWRLPALEVGMRIFYGIALITGIVMMNVHGIDALAIVHRVSAALYLAALVILFLHKLIRAKKD
jgi:hypothetical protein